MLGKDLQEAFNLIDVYLFDQLLKGRILPGHQVLDAGFGGGRNSQYLIANGVDVYGADNSPESLHAMDELLSVIKPDYPRERFRVESLHELSFDTASFDAVICSAVLHFSQNQAHFQQMVRQLWRVLKPGGLFFARLATLDGLEEQVTALGNGWYELPDGSNRFLASLDDIRSITEELGGHYLEDLKTVLVHGQRTMTTWVLVK